MAEDTRSGAAAPLVSGADIRTFLFADMRGYTRYTQEHGDDAASALAGRFADVVKETVPAFEGELLELRGDEALCVFRSARQALRASVELQRLLRTVTDEEPAFPIGVGMGLDAGEAVPTHGGYRGASLNLAARLCGLAKPGEILASETVIGLASRVDGMRFLEGRSAPLKGMARPVRYVVVEPEQALPPVPSLPTPEWRMSRRLLVAAVGVAVLALAAVLFGVLSHGGPGSVRPFARPAVYQVDPTSGRVALGIALGDRPSAIAAGGNAIWVADAGLGVVERVDPAAPQRPVQIPVGNEPTGVVSTPTAVWVANSGDGTVTRIMPSGRTLPFRVGNGPTAIVAYDHAIWVTLSLDDAVVRIDPADDSVSTPIPAGADPTAIGAGAGKLWVTNESRGTVTAIDPKTERAGPPIPVGAGPDSIVADATDVWVGNTLTANVTDLNPVDETTRQVFLLDGGPTSLTAEQSGGVLATTATGSVWRIDRAGARRIASLGVESQASTTFHGKLWVAASAPPAAHQGGTLVLANAGSDLPTRSQPGWSSIDPGSGNAWWYQGWVTLEMTNDGLVTFKKVGGADGGTVVPDLARTIPTPTHGGRVWTFSVRSDVHYSDGELVRPSDFRRAIQRVFQIGFPPYYADIAGADACSPTRCDLRNGIIADDPRHTVTFVLTKPDPEFLNHLALPFADAVPASVPNTDTGTKAIPATGPYMVTSFTPKTGALTLTRNPRFHVWSRDAQPPGYPDHIEWRPFPNGLAALHAIEHGHADWMFDLVPQQALRRAELAHSSQFHPSIFPYTGALFLGVSTAPFHDSLARIALNLAVNRAAFLAAAHAQGQKIATCQLSPPNVFGYEPICPNGPPPPDLATARHDVTESGTKGMRVTVATPKTPTLRQAFRTLASIGYKPAWTSSPNPDVSSQAYEADYPSTANFLEFACPGFCTRYHKLQLLITRAQAAELSPQPGRAGPIWNAAEREFLRIGPPLVPLNNATSPGFVSARVGNYQFAPSTGDSPLIDQMWVK